MRCLPEPVASAVLKAVWFGRNYLKQKLKWKRRMNTSLKFPTLLALLCGTALITDTTFAGPKRAVRDPGVNARQHEQQKRIHEGVKSGELTKQEAKALEKEERALRQEERQFKSDGVLTADERAKLKTDLNKVSQDIYNEKHDGEVRPKAVPPPPTPPSAPVTK